MRRVIKIGGSLLTRPDLPRSLTAWLRQQSPAETLCIVGGGEMIDAIRRLDQVRPMDPSMVHWMCVDLLNAALRIIADWLEWPIVSDREHLQRLIDGGFPLDVPSLVEVSTFYSASENSHAEPLPHDWRTTTDAIAAWLAILSDADELVLLKSCDVDVAASPQELAERGIVDEAFPMIADRVRNVRLDRLPIVDA